MTYSAPLDQMQQTLTSIAQLDQLAETGGFANYDADLVAPILEEANKLARDVLAPLNQTGHQHGATLTNEGVAAAPGFAHAYKQFAEGGWMSLAAPEDFGGQGLPRPLALAVMEMVHGANMAFGLCPLLTLGAIDAIHAHASDDLKARFLPKMISGEWTGAMALTEAGAGSDVGALKTRAEPNADGSYAVTGQKIFITWGDHDMTDNIVHLVLARLPDAPAGPKGISLFVMSKYAINADGSSGERNAFRCIGLENKMGIHASPTCVMEYDGATGYLVGQPHNGLAAMFTMMNAARLEVGLQGVGCSEAALQTASAYAAERSQFGVAINTMPDVKRMLASIAVKAAASRAICYATASAADMAHHGADDETRAAAKAREDLLTPIAKAWSTDRAVEATSDAVQVLGGMGFMNETLACQLYLDARITPIYEGTNGIQAMDLVGRKLSGDNGAAMQVLLSDIRKIANRAATFGRSPFDRIANGLNQGVQALSEATEWMLAAMRSDRPHGQAGAAAYLELAGDVLGAALLAQSALDACESKNAAAAHATGLASVMTDTRLVLAAGRAHAVIHGAGVLDLAVSPG